MIKKNMKILHISEIDNDFSKGTSAVIPQYIISQKKYVKKVGLLNCNNIKLKKLLKEKNIYNLNDNKSKNILKIFEPDIVIFHEVYKISYIKLYKMCVKKKIPYIIIPHGCLTEYAQSHKKLKKIIGNFLLFNSFIENASSIQYLSENELKTTAFPKKKYYVIGNGIDDIPPKNLYLEKQNIEKQLIYIGRYDYYIKGLDQLILACSLIKKELIQNKTKLLLYGVGTTENCQKITNDIQKYDLDGIVIQNKGVYGAEKRTKILESSIFIQVSRSEGQPLGIMEAMSLGMPVIVSYGTGFSNVIIKNGGFSCKCDAKEISNTILKMMTSNLKECSKLNYAYATRHFSWNKIAEKSIEKYVQIIEGVF